MATMLMAPPPRDRTVKEVAEELERRLFYGVVLRHKDGTYSFRVHPKYTPETEAGDEVVFANQKPMSLRKVRNEAKRVVERQKLPRVAGLD